MANIARAGAYPRGMPLGPSRAVNDRRALQSVGYPLVTGKGDSPAVLNVIIAARSIRKRDRPDAAAAIVDLDAAVIASLSLAGRNAEVTLKRMLSAEMFRLVRIDNMGILKNIRHRIDYSIDLILHPYRRLSNCP